LSFAAEEAMAAKDDDAIADIKVLSDKMATESYRMLITAAEINPDGDWVQMLLDAHKAAPDVIVLKEFHDAVTE